jgi:hypothetical protein
MPRLLPRIRLRDDDAHRVLIESLKAAFASQGFEVAANRAVASPQNAFVGWRFERKIAKLIDRH